MPQSGVALLAMLILVLVIVLTLGSIFYRHQLDVAQAIRMAHGDQALLLALSSESWARQLLEDDQRDSDYDSLLETWAQAVPLLPVDGGSLSGCIIDLQSRFNLNNFSGYSPESWLDEMDRGGAGFIGTYLALLQQLELPGDVSRAAVLVDWIDEDNELVDSAGAEQRDYDFLSPPRLIGNQKLVELPELADVAGYDMATVAILENLVTVLPTATAINVNTAPPAVLSALGSTWGPAFVDTVVGYRPFEDVNSFYLTLVDSLGLSGIAEAQTVIPTQLVSVTTGFFQLNIDARIGQAHVEMRSTLQRQETGAVAVIKRDLTFVPAISQQADNRFTPAPLCAPREDVDSGELLSGTTATEGATL